MNEIFVLIYQSTTTDKYQFYHTEEEAQKTLEMYKKNNLYAVIEKWDMVKFANWVSHELFMLGYRL